jgi:hypothetical protein
LAFAALGMVIGWLVVMIRLLLNGIIVVTVLVAVMSMFV